MNADEWADLLLDFVGSPDEEDRNQHEARWKLGELLADMDARLQRAENELHLKKDYANE